jgi:hypothetical protein
MITKIYTLIYSTHSQCSDTFTVHNFWNVIIFLQTELIYNNTWVLLRQQGVECMNIHEGERRISAGANVL